MKTLRKIIPVFFVALIISFFSSCFVVVPVKHDNGLHKGSYHHGNPHPGKSKK